MLQFKTDFTSVIVDENTKLKDFGVNNKWIWLDFENKFIIIVTRTSDRVMELLKHHLKHPDKYSYTTTSIHCKNIEIINL